MAEIKTDPETKTTSLAPAPVDSTTGVVKTESRYRRRIVERVHWTPIMQKVYHAGTTVIGQVMFSTNGQMVYLSPKAPLSDKRIEFDNKGTKSLFESKEALLKTTDPKEGIYQHYRGGYYRKIQSGVEWREQIDGDVLGVGTLYEHAFPHEHNRFWRLETEFNNPEKFNLIVPPIS